jgi:reactive intermediate/imine deaminase
MIRIVEIPGMPEPVSHYADAVCANGFMYLSGLLPADSSLDAASQAAQIFATMTKILAAENLTLADVVKVTLFLTDLNDRQSINEIRKQVFGAHRPASTLVEISKLITGARVEIDAIAALHKQEI